MLLLVCIVVHCLICPDIYHAMSPGVLGIYRSHDIAFPFFFCEEGHKLWWLFLVFFLLLSFALENYANKENK